MKQKKRAALLCRVSTSSQENVRQVAELTDLATSKGYLVEPDDIYEDTISGFTRYQDRPALSKLFQNIKQKKKNYDMVFVMEISRISRKPEEGQKILIEFSDLGIPVYVKNINQCTHDDSGKKNPFFNIIFTLLSEFAASEAAYIKERSISGMRQKIKTGHAGGGVFLPYGYTRDEDKQLVIDEDEAEVVRSIYDYAKKGMGLKTICAILNESGIPTKSQKVIQKGTIMTRGTGTIKRVKETKHIRWEEGTVQAMLTNTIYKGERIYKGQVVPAPVIIEPELFDKIQLQRREKFDTRSREMRYLYLLKGICTCGVCGRNMAGRYKPDTRPGFPPKDNYYQCSSKRHAHMNCQNVSPNIEALESICWDVIKDSARTIEHLKSTGGKMTEAKDKKEMLEQDLKFMLASIQEAEAERERVKTLFKRGIISEDELVRDFDKFDKLVKTRTGTAQKIKKQIQAVAESMVMMSNLDGYLAWAKRNNLTRFEVAEVMANVFERVTVTSVERHKNNNKWIVSIWLKDLIPPFTVLMEYKQRNQSKGFIRPELIQEAGHNRFKYIPLADSLLHHVKYSEDGLLVTPTEEVVEMIMNQEPEDYTIYATKLQQENCNGQLIAVSDTIEGYAGPVQVEAVPRLIKFEDSNATADVKTLKEKKRKEGLPA